MKVAIMQPYIFPYIGYFELIESSDIFVFLDDVNYIKKGWVNRNFLLANNKKLLFTVPLEKASQNKKINEISLSGSYNDWLKKLKKTIILNYKTSKNFDDKLIFFDEIMKFNSKNISELASRSVEESFKLISDSKKIFLKSSNLKIKGSSEDRIIKICIDLGATEYINLYGGVNLYNFDNFKKNNIDLKFIKTKDPIEYMSILHLIMSDKKISLKNYNLFGEKDFEKRKL